VSAAALDRTGNTHQAPIFHSVAELCSTSIEVLEGWLADQQGLYPATPRDTAAAFLFGTLAWALCEAIATRWLAAGVAPTLSAAPLRLAMVWEHWQEDGEEGDHVVCRFDSIWAQPGEPTGPDPVSDLAEALRARLEPLVSLLSQRAGIPASALWRLLGDAIGGSFLEAARGGDTTVARAAATALLAASPAPVRNKQMQFEELVLPQNRHPRGEIERRWFRKRGGCCRYYKVEGGHYCTTCVLRDDASRTERLLDYMERQCRIAADAGSA
jgi:hypothetical protein